MANDAYRTIDLALNAAGLSLRGGLNAGDNQIGCHMSDDRPVATVLLVGNMGGAFWSHFQRSHQDPDNALDRWSREVIEAAIQGFGFEVAMPNDGPPYLPFQHWAMAAEPVFPSPLKILIHPDYGLWHAYRGAILSADPVDIPKRKYHRSPCETCSEKPCLSACPVDAVSQQNYEIGICADHMKSPGGVECLTGGCKARHACPVGREYAYENPQSAFHGQAFLAGLEN